MDTPLKIERARRGLSTQALANAVGVSQPTINRIENAVTRPSPALAMRLERFLGRAVTRDQIMYPEEYSATGRKRRTAPQEAAR